MQTLKKLGLLHYFYGMENDPWQVIDIEFLQK